MTAIPLIIIAGPTAVGKTDLAIQIAGRLRAELLSADSMQVYKYMDIGTAKPSLSEQGQIKHHLIDLVDPDQPFSVADYQTAFESVVASLIERDIIPIMVGGTGLYIRACLQSFRFEPKGPDLRLRQELKDLAKISGVSALYQELLRVDPLSAAQIHPNDLVRCIRALEVYRLTGKPLSAQQFSQPNPKYRPIYIFLDRDRTELYHRIEVRVEMMLEKGLITEVESLLKRGYSPELKPMQSLGYRQLIQYLQSQLTLTEAVALIKQQTRNYAKRQLTWFRKEPVDRWFTLNSKEEYFGEILRYLEGRLRVNVE